MSKKPAQSKPAPKDAAPAADANVTTSSDVVFQVAAPYTAEQVAEVAALAAAPSAQTTPTPKTPAAKAETSIEVTGPQTAIVTGEPDAVRNVLETLRDHGGEVKADNGATISGPITGHSYGAGDTTAAIMVAFPIVTPDDAA